MKKIKLLLGTIGLVSLAAGGGLYLHATYQSEHVALKNIQDDCSATDIEAVKERAHRIESDKQMYASSTKMISGQSTEGGHQNNFLAGGQIVLKEQVFFGETGKSEASYYLEDGRVFYINKKNYEYVKPLYDNSSGEIKKVVTKEFYLDKNQKLCSWYLDGKLQQNDKDTVELVSYLLTGLNTTGNDIVE